ncbi:hypothetical protein CDD82_603 [Ophiocordyceps australis]|uniref:LysM domain-containing protein n=1 Tax=Ophiocordyceps australis TaxID=1399860 RepID=A0A2C5YKZ4_9HYPO|nr:hypothetical protein CDD82_603 [Ophiocordyceps australis]
MPSLVLSLAVHLTTYCLTTTALTRHLPPTSPPASNSHSNCTGWYEYDAKRHYQDILAEYSITLEQFHQWNPSITSTGKGLVLGHSYCVQGPSSTLNQSTVASSLPQASSAPRPVPIPQCTAFHSIQPGQHCWFLMQMYGTFTMQQFKSWNPDIDPTCSRLWPGDSVCVGVDGTPTPRLSNGPQPIQSGVTPNCTKFHRATWRENCLLLATRENLALSDFYKWNPAVRTPCANFFEGYHYCVSVS